MHSDTSSLFEWNLMVKEIFFSSPICRRIFLSHFLSRVYIGMKVSSGLLRENNL